MLADGDATIVHATSFPYVKRSHFEGQNIMESGNMVPLQTEQVGLVVHSTSQACQAGLYRWTCRLIVRGSTELDNYYPANLTAPQIQVQFLPNSEQRSDGTRPLLSNGWEKISNPPKLLQETL